jgi:small subunit ribosomal protein S10
MRYYKTVALRIKMASYSLLNIQDTCNQIKSLSVSTDKEVLIKGPYPLPNKKRRWCLLKSPHVYKKSREHFELTTHRRAVDLYTELSNVDKYGKMITDLKLPPGVRTELQNQ